MKTLTEAVFVLVRFYSVIVNRLGMGPKLFKAILEPLAIFMPSYCSCTSCMAGCRSRCIVIHVATCSSSSPRCSSFVSREFTNHWTESKASIRFIVLAAARQTCPIVPVQLVSPADKTLLITLAINLLQVSLFNIIFIPKNLNV